MKGSMNSDASTPTTISDLGCRTRHQADLLPLRIPRLRRRARRAWLRLRLTSPRSRDGQDESSPNRRPPHTARPRGEIAGQNVLILTAPPNCPRIRIPTIPALASPRHSLETPEQLSARAWRAGDATARLGAAAISTLVGREDWLDGLPPRLNCAISCESAAASLARLWLAAVVSSTMAAFCWVPWSIVLTAVLISWRPIDCSRDASAIA